MVGEEVACWLRAKVEEADQLVPPVNGWQFLDGSKWPSDPTLESLVVRGVTCQWRGRSSEGGR